MTVFGGAGEDLALLEEADLFDVAVEVVAEHRHHAGDEGGAEETGFFGERVFQGMVPGLRCRGGGERFAVANAHLSGYEAAAKMGHPILWRSPRICGFREEVGVLLAGEGAGDGFAEAEGEEAGADGGFLCRGGVGDDDAGRGERVGEAVVAVDAGDLFDEVDLALEVETPGGEFYVEGCVLIGRPG